MSEKELQNALETIIDLTKIDEEEVETTFEDETDTAQFAIIW